MSIVPTRWSGQYSVRPGIASWKDTHPPASAGWWYNLLTTAMSRSRLKLSTGGVESHFKEIFKCCFPLRTMEGSLSGSLISKHLFVLPTLGDEWGGCFLFNVCSFLHSETTLDSAYRRATSYDKDSCLLTVLFALSLIKNFTQKLST